jgi:hypothetical protein
LVEGTPYRLDGDNVLTRRVVFAGREYAIQERVESRAELNDIFLGYQFNPVQRGHGHLGFQAGVAILDASGTVTAPQRAITGTEQYTAAAPLAGLSARGFVGRRVELRGSVRGMAFGGYGHYVRAEAMAGLRLGPVSLLGGYMLLDADLHERQVENRTGIAPRIQGPVVAVEFRVP